MLGSFWSTLKIDVCSGARQVFCQHLQNIFSNLDLLRWYIWNPGVLKFSHHLFPSVNTPCWHIVWIGKDKMRKTSATSSPVHEVTSFSSCHLYIWRSCQFLRCTAQRSRWVVRPTGVGPTGCWTNGAVRLMGVGPTLRLSVARRLSD